MARADLGFPRSSALNAARAIRFLRQSFAAHLNPKFMRFLHNVNWSANETFIFQKLKGFPAKTLPFRRRTHAKNLQSVFILSKCNSDFSVRKLEIDGVVDNWFIACAHGQLAPFLSLMSRPLKRFSTSSWNKINGKLLTMGTLIFESNIVRDNNRRTFSKAAYDSLIDIGRLEGINVICSIVTSLNKVNLLV